MTKLIRRYQTNQKMYDTEGCGYIKMSEILEAVRNGEIKILDTPSQRDSTGEILLKAMFSKEKDLPKEERLSVTDLNKVIRHGGFLDYISYLEKQEKPSCKGQE